VAFDESAPYLTEALEYAGNSHTVEDVRALVEQGGLQFWPGLRSALVTQIIQSPRRRAFHFFLAGGAMAEIQRLYPIALQWGRSEGCEVATMVGRHGWQRTWLTKDAGWTAPLTYYEKVLR
jgi:hypothetical protein